MLKSEIDKKNIIDINKIIDILILKADNSYCKYAEIMGRNECCGKEYKLKNNNFGESEFNAHNAGALELGRHKALYEAVHLIKDFIGQSGVGNADE